VNRLALISISVIITIVALAVVAGCGTTEEHLALAQVTHNPLDHDPTDEQDLTGWWAGGGAMIRLDQVGSYALYGSVNRYAAPIERGRWAQMSYAQVRLDPYSMMGGWTRVSISRIDDRLAVTIPGREPMFAIDAPPGVTEDQLVGTWTGDIGQLTILASGHYAFEPAAAMAGPDDPAIIAGHAGTWRLAGDRVEFSPDPPNLGRFELEFDEAEDAEGDQRELRGSDGVFRPLTIPTSVPSAPA